MGEKREAGERGRDVGPCVVGAQAHGAEQQDGRQSRRSGELEGRVQPPIALEGRPEEDQQDRRAERQQRFFVVEAFQERRQRRGEEKRDREAVARPVSARQPARDEDQHEAEQDRGAVGDLDQSQRDGFLQEPRSIGERGEAADARSTAPQKNAYEASPVLAAAARRRPVEMNRPASTRLANRNGIT